MASYLVSYDQHRDRDYTPIWTALRSNGAVRILESVWLLDISNTASEIRDWLRKTTRDEDSLVVVELKAGSGWATYNVQADGLTWLRQKVLA